MAPANYPASGSLRMLVEGRETRVCANETINFTAALVSISLEMILWVQLRLLH